MPVNTSDTLFAKNFRMEKTSLDKLTGDEWFMPYEISGEDKATSQHNDDKKNVFGIPEEQYDINCQYIHLCKARIDLNKIMEAKEKSDVSLLPYLTDVVSSAIAKNFNCGDSAVVIMSGVDQRPILNINTFVNCSDSIFLPVTGEMRRLAERDRCKMIKASMKEQLDSSFHRKLAKERVDLVKDFEANPLGVVSIAEGLANMPSEDNFTPVTMVLSNIGDMTLGDSLDQLLDDFMLYNSAKANFVVFNYFGDYMNMIVGNQNDSSKLADSIVSEFRGRGIEAELSSEEHYYGDVFKFD